MLKIGFVGAGGVASNLALALSARGYQVVEVASQGGESARRLAACIRGCAAGTAQSVADAADLVFIATPDGAIEEVAASTRWRREQMVAHVSGERGLEPLEPARRAGALIGSFHPLQTLTRTEDAAEALAAFEGVAFAIDGDAGILTTLEQMAGDLGGWVLRLRPEDRPLYHASAVMAAGYLLALLNEAAGVWQAMGLSRDEALKALFPLSRRTLRNAGTRGLDASVTGPIVRGDAGTVRRHLEALLTRVPGLVDLYCQLGLASLPIARMRGASPAAITEMEALFHTYIQSGR